MEHMIRCANCGTPAAKIDECGLVVTSRHHGQLHDTVIYLDAREMLQTLLDTGGGDIAPGIYLIDDTLHARVDGRLTCTRGNATVILTRPAKDRGVFYAHTPLNFVLDVAMTSPGGGFVGGLEFSRPDAPHVAPSCEVQHGDPHGD